jgi:hypothetical protein
MKIWYEDFDQGDLDVDYEFPEALTGVRLTTGVSLRGLLSQPLQMKIRYRKTRPAAFAAGPINVVDERIKDILESARSEIEFYPVEVTDKKDGHVLPYFFMNVLSELDCMDRPQSEFEDFKGYAQNIVRLRLKNDCSSLDAFRLARTLPPLIIVADELAQRLSGAGRLALKFVDVERYRDPALI